MSVPLLSLRVAVVQFCPKIGQLQLNILRAREICRKLKPQSIDLLCFPEMAFTGYVFENASAIQPHLEKSRTGPTSEFCSELAKQLQCYVVAGYPEALSADEVNNTEITTTQKMEGESTRKERIVVGANSAVLFGPNGEWTGGYRKTNLFETDMSWAKAGNGFATFKLPEPLRTMSLGICMDLNPQPPKLWTLADGPYEIADYCLEKKTNLLILLNAWLDSGEESEDDHDWGVLNYWAARLKPLWEKDDDSDCHVTSDDENTPEDDGELGEEIIIIVCNRSGEENGKTFAGTSAIFSMRRGSGRPKLLDMMGRTEEAVRIWNIQVQKV